MKQNDWITIDFSDECSYPQAFAEIYFMDLAGKIYEGYCFDCEWFDFLTGQVVQDVIRWKYI